MAHLKCFAYTELFSIFSLSHFTCGNIAAKTCCNCRYGNPDEKGAVISCLWRIKRRLAYSYRLILIILILVLCNYLSVKAYFLKDCDVSAAVL